MVMMMMSDDDDDDYRMIILRMRRCGISFHSLLKPKSRKRTVKLMYF